MEILEGLISMLSIPLILGPILSPEISFANSHTPSINDNHSGRVDTLYKSDSAYGGRSLPATRHHRQNYRPCD